MGEHEQRWTLVGHCDCRPVYWLTADGPMLDDGERIEVVPAARLAEAERERDEARALPLTDNLIMKGTVEGLARQRDQARAGLARAREALEAADRELAAYGPLAAARVVETVIRPALAAITTDDTDTRRYARNFREAMERIRRLPPSERCAMSNRERAATDDDGGDDA